MRTDSIFQTKYLKASSLLGGERTLRIQRVVLETMQDGSKKPIVYFHGVRQGLVLNRTNANTIETECNLGPETSDWVGKSITLYVTPVEYQGRRVPGLRVRPANGAATEEPPFNEPIPDLAPDADDPRWELEA